MQITHFSGIAIDFSQCGEPPAAREWEFEGEADCMADVEAAIDEQREYGATEFSVQVWNGDTLVAEIR